MALAPLLSHLAGVELRYRTVMKYNSFKNKLAYLTTDRHREPVGNVRVISHDNPTMDVWAAAENVFLNPTPHLIGTGARQALMLDHHRTS